MISPKPLVSVLMPVYNAGKYLSQAIESILGQTFQDFEFIIIDDGSTDDSKAIVKSYQDSRIVFVANEYNKKLVETLNSGFDLCQGKYIVRMDADDISMPQRIEKQVAFMEAHPEVGICGTGMHIIGDQHRKATYLYQPDDTHIRFRMLCECHMLHPSVIIRTAVIREHGIKMTILHGEDYDFFMKIGAVSKMANLAEPLLEYRQLDNSMSRSNAEITERNSNKIKIGLFHSITSEVAMTEVLLFQEAAYQMYKTATAEKIETLETLFHKLLMGNIQLYCPDSKGFARLISEAWYAYLYNSVSISPYFRLKKMLTSPLVQFGAPPLILLLKSVARTLLRPGK